MFQGKRGNDQWRYAQLSEEHSLLTTQGAWEHLVAIMLQFLSVFVYNAHRAQEVKGRWGAGMPTL